MAKRVLGLGKQNSRGAARTGCAGERTPTDCMPADKSGCGAVFTNHANVIRWQKAVAPDSRAVTFAVGAAAESEGQRASAANAAWRRPSATAPAAIAQGCVPGGRAVSRTVGGEAQNPQTHTPLAEQANKLGEREWAAGTAHGPNPGNGAGCSGSLYGLQPAPAGSRGDGRLRARHTPGFFCDRRDHMPSAEIEGRRPGKKRERHRRAPGIAVCLSHGAEMARSRIKRKVRHPQVRDARSVRPKYQTRAGHVSMSEVAR